MALDTRDELLAGRYRKLETIGVGGMARVYLAEDERLGRRVAVKLLHSDSPEHAAERFEREAKLGASLNHPNIISVFDITTAGESVLIVMEYVDGETLKDAIAEGPMPADEVIGVMGDIAAALDHAHAHGVVHRDVKPANILLRRRDGTAKLADLGIATAAEGTRITHSGIVLGTASYMAPEQLDGRAAGPASDVYSLATVTFEALTGRKARTGSTPVEVAHRIINDPPPDLRESWPDAPEGAAKALQRAMSERPEDRPTSARQLVAELERELALDAGRSPPPALRMSRKLPSWAPAAAVLVGFCLVGAIVLAVSGGGGDATERADRGDSAAAGKQRGQEEAPRESGSGGSAGGAAAAPANGGSGQPASGSAGGQSPGGSSGGSAGTSDPAALNDQGYRLMKAGRYDEATPLLQRAVNAYPEGSKDLTYAFALYNLGRSLRLAGRPTEAIPILERRLRIPNQTETVRQELEAARQAAG